MVTTKSSIDIIMELESKLEKINQFVDKRIENCKVNKEHFLENEVYDRVIVFDTQLKEYETIKRFIQTLK